MSSTRQETAAVEWIAVLCWIVARLCKFTWRAAVWALWWCPVGGLALVLAALGTWTQLTYGWAPLAASTGSTLAAAVLCWWKRPHWLSWALSIALGQIIAGCWLRPRWTTAMHATGLAPTVMGVVRVPGLVRVRVRNSIHHLTVAMAPGQHPGDWLNAADALAHCLGATAVTVTPARPGTVALAVMMRDPLRRTTTAADPTRSLDGPIRLGTLEDGTPFQIDPQQPQHIAAQGATRSGKSQFMYGLLSALAHRREVIVCGIDPSGILLRPFEEGRGRRWIATGATGPDLERAVEVLEDLVTVMDFRIRDLVAQGADKIPHFTAALPSIWVVLEEWPGTMAALKADDAATGRPTGQRLAARAERAIGRLTREGLKVGIVRITVAQRMSANAIDTDDRSNIGIRLTLRVDNADAVKMLHEGVTIHIDTIRQWPAGVGMVEAPGQPLQRVRINACPYDQFAQAAAEGVAATRPADLDGDVLIGEVIDLSFVKDPEPEPTPPPTPQRRRQPKQPRKTAA